MPAPAPSNTLRYHTHATACSSTPRLACPTRLERLRVTTVRPGRLDSWRKHTQRHRNQSHSPAANAQNNTTEAAALATYSQAAKDSGDAGEAQSLLAEAVSTRKVSQELVTGALAFLEQHILEAGTQKDVLEALDGTWQLVFSSATVRWLQYIPVMEVAVIDAQQSSIALVSELGLLSFRFEGSFSWRSPFHMDFGFQGLQVMGFGRTLIDRTLSGSQKTYTYYLVTDSLAAARSTGGGGLILMSRCPT